MAIEDTTPTTTEVKAGQSPEIQQEIEDLRKNLEETQENSRLTLQELVELRAYLTPDLDQDPSVISLEKALGLSGNGKDESSDAKDFDWKTKNRARSRIATEDAALLSQLREIGEEISSFQSELRRITWDQEDRRADVERIGYYGRERVIHKINRGIRGAFLGIREHFEGFAKKDLQEKIESLEQESARINSQLDTLRVAGRAMDKELSEEFLSEFETKIKTSVSIWGKYAETHAGSEWIGREITDRYVQERILPVIQNQIDEGEVSTEDRDQFLVDLDELLQAIKVGDSEQVAAIRQKMAEKPHVFYRINQQLNFLLNREDLGIVEDISAHLAYEQIQAFVEKTTADLDYQLHRRVERKLEWCLKHTQINLNRRRLGDWKVQPLSDKKAMSYRKMEFFQFVRDSEIARGLCGPFLRELDHEIYQEALKESLTDKQGQYIDTLYYYPTPDAIKRLVILAAADSQSYRTNHANTTLTSLANKDSWGTILAHATENLPELNRAQAVLTDWSHGEYYNHPDIKRDASALVFRVLHDESEPEELRFLAEEALLNHVLIAELVERGLVSEEKNQAYQQVYLLMQSKDYQNSLWNWEYQVREILQRILRDGKEGENYSQLIEDFNLSVHLGTLWLEAQDDDEKLIFLSSLELIRALRPQGGGKLIELEQLDLINQALDDYPSFKGPKRRVVTEAFSYAPDYYITQKGLEFLQEFVEVYSDLDYSDNLLNKIIVGVADGELAQSRALELPQLAPDLIRQHLASQHPGIFMVDVEFGRRFLETYDDIVVRKMVMHINDGSVPRELALAFNRILPSIFGEKEDNLRNYIFEQGQLLAQNEDDLNFLNKLIGRHGAKSLQLLKEYVPCVEAGVVNTSNRDKVLEFTLRFRVLSPTIVEGYLAADQANMTEGYISELQQIAEKLIGTESLSEEERSKPYYQDLIRAVYPHNSGHWTTYKSNDSCRDRSTDIENFTYETRYEIDLLSSAEIKVKEGMKINFEDIDTLKHSILDVAKEMEASNYDLEKLKTELVVDIDANLSLIKSEGGLEDIDISQIEDLDEKIFLLLVDSVFGTRQINTEEIKKLILRYEFAFFDDIRDYIQGTTDRVSQANNQDYALMCELHSFFADRIKEINRRAVNAGWANNSIQEAMPRYFAKFSREKAVAQTKDQLNRLRVDRLGLSESFLEQIGRTLERRRGKKYSSEQIMKLITLYESFADGLVGKTTDSEKGTTKAFYGQLKAQRERTLSAIEAIIDERVDPQDYHLGDINLEDLAISVAGIEAGAYDDEQFQAFTTLRFINLFADEKNLLESELNKFESETGKQRQIVNGFITKSKESAHARMVGGVCVSGDNPTDRDRMSRAENMWDEQNFFQFVLQDPESHRCQGLVILHHFEEDGKKVLAASFNPSSTYLYSVDEASLFEGIMGKLEKFATANDFDMIVMSQNKTIRTNRTQGGFERAMDERREGIGKTFTFASEKRFSFKPGYLLKEMDVIWEK